MLRDEPESSADFAVVPLAARLVKLLGSNPSDWLQVPVAPEVLGPCT